METETLTETEAPRLEARDFRPLQFSISEITIALCNLHVTHIIHTCSERDSRLKPIEKSGAMRPPMDG